MPRPPFVSGAGVAVLAGAEVAAGVSGAAVAGLSAAGCIPLVLPPQPERSVKKAITGWRENRADPGATGWGLANVVTTG